MLEARRESRPSQKDVPICSPSSRLHHFLFLTRDYCCKGTTVNWVVGQPLAIAPFFHELRPRAAGERAPCPPRSLHPLLEASKRRMPASCCGLEPLAPGSPTPSGLPGRRRGVCCRRAPRLLPKLLPASGRALEGLGGHRLPPLPEGRRGAGRRGQAAAGKLGALIAAGGSGRFPREISPFREVHEDPRKKLLSQPE